MWEGRGEWKERSLKRQSWARIIFPRHRVTSGLVVYPDYLQYYPLSGVNTAAADTFPVLGWEGLTQQGGPLWLILIPSDDDAVMRKSLLVPSFGRGE